ncbi:MAG: class I SAM-dependent methyltransferase [Sulfitobacter sp.]
MLDNALRIQVPQRVALAVDLGCGPGVQLESWRAYADRVVGIDQHAEQVDENIFDDGVELVTDDVTDLPFADDSVDLVLALDVLEHVPDVAVLQQAARVLKPGGTMLVSVPAFQWLWSFRDEGAGHLRRYTKSQICQRVEQAGMQVCRVRYYQFFLFPLVVLSRKLGKTSKVTRDAEDFPPGVVNTIFRTINRFEARLDGLGIRFPIGSSIIVTARKV